MHSEKQEGLEANVLPVQEGYLKYLEDKKPEKEKKRVFLKKYEKFLAVSIQNRLCV